MKWVLGIMKTKFLVAVVLVVVDEYDNGGTGDSSVWLNAIFCNLKVSYLYLSTNLCGEF